MTEQTAHFTHEDRKILIEVETKLGRAIQDIQGLSNNFASKEEFADLERRINKLEPKVDTLNMKSWIAIGAIMVITGTVIPMALYIFNNKSNVDYDKIRTTVQRGIEDYNLTLEK